eukprot:COSAG02_NODE_1101_length_14572_cov_10.347267_1_plen_248_part_00
MIRLSLRPVRRSVLNWIYGCCAVLTIVQCDHLSEQVLGQLRAALTERGYFYCAVGDALPPGLIKRAYEQSRLAHALPLELLRSKYADPLAPYRGFSNAEPEYDASATSLLHSWDFGRDVPRLPKDDPDHEYVGPNVYADDELPEMRPVIDELYDRQDEVARMMFQAFAEMFKLHRDTFSQHFSWRSSSSLRLLFYPGSESVAAEQRSAELGALPSSGISPHTDFELFTLMSMQPCSTSLPCPSAREC